MAQMFHWMLGKMNDQTIEDYKQNPEQVVAQLLAKHSDTDVSKIINNSKPKPLLEAASSVEEVGDLP